MKKNTGSVLCAALLLTFCGCQSPTDISLVRILDPERELTIDAVVQNDGTFYQESEKDRVVCSVSGMVRNASDGFYTVKLVYDRRFQAEAGRTTTEKIETKFQAKPDVEIPFGQNSATPIEPSIVESALTTLSLKLIKLH